MQNLEEISVLVPEIEIEDINYSSTCSIILCFLCWILFYFTVKLIFPNKSPEWCSRIVALFHGIGAACNGLSECYTGKDDLFQNFYLPMTENQQVIFVVSLGYFMLDTLWCLYYQTEGKLMMAHHIFSVCAIYRMLWKNNAGAQTVCALGGMEVTNPILQMRWFLRDIGFKESSIFTGVELFFVCFFFVMRLGFGTYFFLNVLNTQDDLEYICLTTGLYIISLMFVINIAQYLTYKYFPEPKTAT